MNDKNIHFSSNSDEWETPNDIFLPLYKEFNFEYDLCATSDNHKCTKWTNNLGKYVDQAINGTVYEQNLWMNPPYSRGLQKVMVGYAHDLSMLGRTVVMLLPARTDTQMFHKYIWDERTHKPKTGVEMRLLKGRIKFEINGVAKDAAPFPSMIVIFRG